MSGQPDPQGDKLKRVKLLVVARTQKLSQRLESLLQQVQEYSGTSTTWIDGEMRHLQDQLDKLEELESTTWMKVAAMCGKAAHQKRLGQWQAWQARQHDRIRRIQTMVRDLCSRQPGDHEDGHHRRYGHVEKVKLPVFSGKLEDFSEWRNQFKELCKGEMYTPVLELAQMRLKLPREALAAIAGLQSPVQAWIRLEDVYGNRELSILSALKNLRDFKASKTASHEQVIELAMALQKCHTEVV